MSLKKEIIIPKDLFELANNEFETNWKSDKVKVKRFLRGDIGKIQQACIKAKSSMGLEFSATLDTSLLLDFTVMQGVAEAPWGANDLAQVQNLPPPIFDWAYNQITEFNTLSDKKKETLDTSQEVARQESTN
jgi:hypothetical protein